MSLDTCRERARQSIEKQVEVNQRALIDKILARYAAEFVIYRELMQNSDDAKSSSVEIIYETANPSEDIKLQDKFKRITFRNNGLAFSSEDWDRLRQIADGNPDEQKIGAFGVGFYSLFSVCEEPFVSSGGQGMDFSWRGNQLVTRSAQFIDIHKGWTTFLMDVRTPTEFPNIEKFARFLATSLVDKPPSGFTGNLLNVSVYFNKIPVIQLSKNMQQPKLMNVTSAFDTHSPQKLFCLTSVNVRDVQLDVKKLLITTKKSIQLQSLPITSYQTEESSISFKVASGNVNVNVTSEFSAEMKRTTKKKPPSKTTIQMIFTEFEDNKNISPVFKDLLPCPEQGRIYIGFPTHQTTGFCFHLAARVIPTVDRDSIDLVDPTLAKYNREMLCIGGILCRILYESEMAQISLLYNEEIDNDEQTNAFHERLERRAAQALTNFTFKQSTPNSKVGLIIESQFFYCSKRKLPILSTSGVLPISNVRMSNLGFIKKIPVIPKIILEQCRAFFTKSKDIKELALQDVLYELKSRALSEDEMVELLRWWIYYRGNNNGNNVSQSELTQFMQFARIGDNFQALNTIRYYSNSSKIPIDVDVPVDVLPRTISDKLTNQELKIFFGWSELPLINWARFIVKNPDLEFNPTFAEKVLQILARNISQSDKEIIRQLFVQKKCILTQFGMMIPNEAYFQDVDLLTVFPDLPKVQFQNPFSVQNIMQLLGVRKVVDLKVVLNRLVMQGNWNHVQLAAYLTSVSKDLGENEMNLLKKTPIWPKENSVNLQPNKSESKEIISMAKTQRFIASDLYAPLAIHREFGLPVLDWEGRWDRYMKEAKFLFELGLQKYPTLQKILQLAAPPTDIKIRNRAFEYFNKYFKEQYSNDYNSAEVDIAFLPCSDKDIYAKPSECFINRECSIMNFQTISQELQFPVEPFGVCQHPDREKLINKLMEDPPRDKDKAKKIFEYLASRQGDFILSDWNKLANIEFIPIQDKLQPPRYCFFKINKESSLNEFFSCVDFGEIANEFLSNCGVKNEPSPIEIAELLVNFSAKLWKSGKNKYLSILRKIAIYLNHIGSLNEELIKEMGKKPILVALKKERHNSEEEVNCYSLKSAKDIFINDNIIYQQVFNPLTAPEEDCMDKLYKKLGCKSLNNSVKEIPTLGTIQDDTVDSLKLQKTITERAPLFYFEHSKNEINRDESWLGNLKVKNITDITINYILETTNEFETQEKSTTACIQDTHDSCTLYVTPNPKLHNISQHIAKNIYKSYNFKNISYVSMILTSSISTLKEMGYPVDRILQQPDLDKVIESVEESVRESMNPIGTIRETESSLDLQAKIIENAPLFYDNHPESKIKKDETWVKELKVKEIDYIETSCSLEANKTTITACILKDKCMDSWTLYVTSNPKLLDISKQIVINIYKSYESNDIDYINELLMNPLKRKGSSDNETPRQPKLPKYDQEFFTPDNTQIRMDLQNAVKNCHSNLGSYINSHASNTTVNESPTSYCDIKPGHSLHCVGASQGIELYDPKSVNPEILFELYTAPLSNFVDMLKNLANVFDLPLNAIHIFYDKNSTTIAFNRGGALFFNLKYYLNHYEECKIKPTINAMTYWFMTFCHELAHNFVKVHNADHEYYLLSFAENYMSNFLQIMKKCEIIQDISDNNIEKDQCNTCNIIPEQSLYCVGALQGIELYDSKRVNPEISSQLHAAPLSNFINMLRNLANVFDLSLNAIHVFYDKNSSSIAFNHDGALYFNLKYYLELHSNECKIKPTINAMSYWLMTFCHQLAHNFVKVHNSDHEFYLLSLAENYMPNFLQIMKKYETVQDSSDNIGDQCKIIPAHLLRCVKTLQGIEFYSKMVNPENVSRSHASNFANMLKDLANVFKLPLNTIHTFYDKYSSSIAFNRDGALFFNLKYYLILHSEECEFKPTVSAMTYWFVTFCHQLAHNYVKVHNSSHEYYLLSFAEKYMSSFLEIIIRQESNNKDQCNIIPGHSLYRVGILQDIVLYNSKDVHQLVLLSQSHAIQLNDFVDMLKDFAIVFKISQRAIQIFYDVNSNTNAFNRDGILYFNFKFYLALHSEECKIKPTINTMIYWFMTFCHQIAHNFIGDHNSDHERYFSISAETYRKNFLEVMKKREIL